MTFLKARNLSKLLNNILSMRIVHHEKRTFSTRICLNSMFVHNCQRQNKQSEHKLYSPVMIQKRFRETENEHHKRHSSDGAGDDWDTGWDYAVQEPHTNNQVDIRRIKAETVFKQLCEKCPGSIGRCIEELAGLFSRGDISEPIVSAELLIAHSIQHKTLHGVNRKQELTAEQWQNLREMASKRLQRIPVQYIIGEWDFLDLTLKMVPPVFIPRPETEELVGLIMQDPCVRAAKRFVEVGSGSGAISISLLKQFPNLQGVVLEQGEMACKLTIHNARLNGVSDRLHVIHAKLDYQYTGEYKTVYKEKPLALMKFYPDVTKLLKDGRFNFLVSNPPYISDDAMKKLEPEISWYEDHVALHGGKDGMDLIKKLLVWAPRVVQPNGSIWLEVSAEHPAYIRYMIHRFMPKTSYNCSYPDSISNRPRFVHCAVSEQTYHDEWTEQNPSTSPHYQYPIKFR